jgi:hypothetical protein
VPGAAPCDAGALEILPGRHLAQRLNNSVGACLLLFRWNRQGHRSLLLVRCHFPYLFTRLAETLILPANAVLPAFDAAFTRAMISSPPKLPQESLLHLQVRFRRAELVDKMARVQSTVQAECGETRVLSAHVGGESLQRAGVVAPECKIVAESVVWLRRAGRARTSRITSRSRISCRRGRRPNSCRARCGRPC